MTSPDGARSSPLRSVPPPDPTLEDLLGRTARGDTAAYAAVFDRMAGKVHGVALRVVRDPGMAEDVAQEAFLDAWRQAASFDPRRGSGAAWLLTIAHRRAVDRVRSEQGGSDRERRSMTATIEYDEVADTVEDRLEAERVRRALVDLTDLQREAISLAYYGGYTQQQVSELLGVPLGTIKTRLRDGLIRLRDALGVEP
ncbi:MAG: sigma-70 family RNA polymerase sigma factor [Actinomycetota bacterium]|nr:MAG: sigma-70 family RNA polymerase sigma factor [Actinomycetota bacterium]